MPVAGLCARRAARFRTDESQRGVAPL